MAAQGHKHNWQQCCSKCLMLRQQFMRACLEHVGWCVLSMRNCPAYWQWMAWCSANIWQTWPASPWTHLWTRITPQMRVLLNHMRSWQSRRWPWSRARLRTPHLSKRAALAQRCGLRIKQWPASIVWFSLAGLSAKSVAHFFMHKLFSAACVTPSKAVVFPVPVA